MIPLLTPGYVKVPPRKSCSMPRQYRQLRYTTAWSIISTPHGGMWLVFNMAWVGEIMQREAPRQMRLFDHPAA